MGSLHYRLDGPFDHRILHYDLNFHLRQKIDDIFRPSVQFGMTLLPAEPLGLGHGNALDPDLVKRLLHLVELEGLDDGLNLFHRDSLSSRERTSDGISLHSPCQARRSRPTGLLLRLTPISQARSGNNA